LSKILYNKALLADPDDRFVVGMNIRMTKGILLTAVVLCAFAASLFSLSDSAKIAKAESSSANIWSTAASMPTPRSSFRAVAVNDKIYALGGGVNVNEEYDPLMDSWQTKTPMPTSRRCFAAVEYEGKIYCFGGHYETGRYLDATEVYDPYTDKWETKASLPTPRSQLCASQVDGKIYVMGGFVNPHTGQISNLTEVYEVATDTWTNRAPMPIGEYAHNSVSIGNKIYVVGSALQIYDCEKDAWDIGARPLHYSDSSGVAATSGVNAPLSIYVIGGETGYMEATNLTQIYDPQTNSWTTGASMPTARQSLGLAVVNDVFFAMGGIYPQYQVPYVPSTASDSSSRTEKISMLSYAEPVNFVPQNLSAANERYLPVGYTTPDPKPSNTPASPPPTATPSPSSEVIQSAFPSYSPSPSPTVPEMGTKKVIFAMITALITTVFIVLKIKLSKPQRSN
jgi:N-acetylneuraminic acid mutarotase